MDEGHGGWQGLGSRLLDLIYPSSCHHCGCALTRGDALCAACRDAVPDLEEPFCDKCGEMFDGAIDGAFECANCRGQTFHFEFARPGVPRSEGAMNLIHDFKYSRRLHLARECARMARRAFDDPRLQEPLNARWPLVPVPLHRRRLRWRQFNQAREVAVPLGRELGLPVQDWLKRIRPTTTQTRLSRRQRQQNLRGAFEAARELEGIEGVILVDDVFTTGSTVNECSRVLCRAGVQKVVVVTVMRG